MLEYAKMSLDQLILKTIANREASALQYLAQLALALLLLHDKKIAHRDIKPSNILVFESAMGEG